MSDERLDETKENKPEAAGAAPVFTVKYKTSFTARLMQSDEALQGAYSALKNALLSYQKVKARTSWFCETFNCGRTLCAKINVKGKALALYLNLDPADYEDEKNKYHFQDFSGRAKYARTPMAVRVKSERGLKNALWLIAETMQKLGIEPGREQNETYRFDYADNETLIEKGLIRVLKVPAGSAAIEAEEETEAVIEAPVAAAETVETVEEITPETAEETPVVTVEEAPVAEVVEAVEETPIDETPDEPHEPPVFTVKYKTSFMARLIQSDAELQNAYGVLKNALLSYQKVKARTSWFCETFNCGRILCAKINVKGKALALYLNLDPADYADEKNKYHFQDFSGRAKYARTPMAVRVKSERGLKNALWLIAETMQKLGIEPGREQNETYRFDYEDNEALIEKGLIRVLKVPADGSAVAAEAEEETEVVETPVAAEEAPETVEETPVEAVEETPAETVEETPAEPHEPPVFTVKYKTSFMARLIQSDEALQNAYSVLKNALLSYQKVKARTSWFCETFNCGRTLCAKINVKGKALALYLNLDPADYADEQNKYHFQDFSGRAKYARTPMAVRVKSERGLKNALWLIAEMMQKLGIEPGKEQNETYRFPYEDNEALIEKGLIRVLKVAADGSVAEAEEEETEVAETAETAETVAEQPAEQPAEKPAEKPTEPTPAAVVQKLPEGPGTVPAEVVTPETPVVEEILIPAGSATFKAPVIEEPEVKRVFVPDESMPAAETPDVIIRYRTSFTARLIQAEAPLQDYYTVLKNALLSYKKVKSRISWNFDTFNRGRLRLSRINIKGKTLLLYLALTPADYAEQQNKYHFADVSDKPRFADTPMLLRVKSDRGLKNALSFIAEMMAKYGIPAGVERHEDYHRPYETTAALVEQGLIKVFETKKPEPEIEEVPCRFDRIFKDTMDFFARLTGKYEFFPAIMDLMAAGNTVLQLKKRYVLRAIDEAWVSMIEDCLPALDAVIRKPSKFIEENERVLPIELSRNINSRSLQHLSQHTEYISKIEGDMITPSKILNVFRDETLMTYENKFVNTLINRLYAFVNRRYNVAKKAGQDQKQTCLSFDQTFEHGQVKGKIHFSVEIDEPPGENEKVKNYTYTTSLWERVERLNGICGTYMTSEFAQNMGRNFIRPPVMRTNAILKNKDMRQCLLLWEFIESYEEAGYELLVQENVEQIDESYIEELYSAFALQYVLFRHKIKNDFDEDMKLDGDREPRPLKPVIVDHVEQKPEDAPQVELPTSPVVETRTRHDDILEAVRVALAADEVMRNSNDGEGNA